MSKEEEQLRAEMAQLRAELQATKEHNKQLVDYMDFKEEEAKKDRNYNFIQLYKNQARELRRLSDKSSLALNILLLFGEKMNRQNAIMVSYKALQQITGKSRASLSKAVNILIAENFVKVIKIGTANAYIVNSDVFWTQSAKLKEKLSIFSATVIATGAEQDPEYLENWDKVKLKHMPMIEQNELPLDEEGRLVFDFEAGEGKRLETQED